MIHMSNDLLNFQNPEFGQIKVILRDNQYWFIGKEITMKLGYKDSVNALKLHVDPEDKEVVKHHPLEHNQKIILINESGLYSLILSSKLPNARDFKRWVTKEVLPNIRETGQYNINDNSSDDLLLAKAVLISDKKIKKLERAIIEQKPKVDYFNDVLNNSGLSGIRETGIEFGLGQKTFIHYAHKYKLIYYNKLKQLRPYAHAIKRGYCELRQEKAKNGKYYQRTFITTEGKTYFHKKYTQEQKPNINIS